MKHAVVIALVFALVAVTVTASLSQNTPTFQSTWVFDNAETPSDRELEFQDKFIGFMRKYEKTYGSDEFQQRYSIFKSNMRIIDQMNAAQDGATYGVTKFADLTPEEFKRVYLSPISMDRSSVPADATQWTGSLPELKDIPTSWNWVDHGAVTPVKNQAQCGSCWAFSTTGGLEGQWFKKTGQLLSLSEQQLVDCDHACDPKNPQTCDAGCNGGLMWNAFDYIKQAGGLELESAYPYTAMDGTCKANSSLFKASVTGYTMLPTNEDQMASWLYANGPISIAINAGWLQFYVGGVTDPIICDPKNLDHGVLIVGYTTARTLLGKEVPAWIIKNSWGTSWGEKGYFMIKRGDNKCGLASVPCAPTV